MTGDAPKPSPAPDYLVLLLICATAFLAGLVEVLLVPLYAGSSILPIAVPLGMATTYGLPRLGSWLTGTVAGALLPLVSWFVATLGLALVNRPAGDVLVQGGTSPQQWVLFAMIIGGSVVGFATVVRTGVPARGDQPPRR